MAEFVWASKLGIAVALFLLAGGLHLVIGAVTPVALRLVRPDNSLFVTERSDTAAYGRSTAAWLAAEPELRTYRNVMLHVLAGLLFAAGLLEVALAWFGVRTGQTWALATLSVVGLATIAYWAVALLPYVDARAPLGLSDLPPFMWFPSLAYPPAIALAWWHHLGSG